MFPFHLYPWLLKYSYRSSFWNSQPHNIQHSENLTNTDGESLSLEGKFFPTYVLMHTCDCLGKPVFCYNYTACLEIIFQCCVILDISVLWNPSNLLDFSTLCDQRWNPSVSNQFFFTASKWPLIFLFSPVFLQVCQWDLDWCDSKQRGKP